jgi:hypothetical protein
MLLNVILMDATLFYVQRREEFVLRNFELGMPGKTDFF